MKDKKTLDEVKLLAIMNTAEKTNKYKSDGILANICDSILEKKTALIKNAKSIKEVNEILNEPKPFSTSNGIECGKYSIPEEEMIMWSYASLEAPLNSAATMRYAHLVKDILGYDVLNEVA